MKIAAITLTRNDDFRLVPWKMYFQEYKDELYEHIVVDNGSTPEYQRKLLGRLSPIRRISNSDTMAGVLEHTMQVSVMLFKILKSMLLCL